MDSEQDEKSGPGGSPTPLARILVVDDEEMIQALLTELLTREGYQVTTASDGQQAVDLLERERFDLVITDLVMPGLNGIEVLMAAKRIDPRFPVVVMTGYPSVETVTRLIRLGAGDYITKPFNVEIILVTVAKLLEMRRVSEGPPDQGPHDAGSPEPPSDPSDENTVEPEPPRSEMRHSRKEGPGAAYETLRVAAESIPSIVWVPQFATFAGALLLVALLVGDALGLVSQGRPAEASASSDGSLVPSASARQQGESSAALIATVPPAPGFQALATPSPPYTGLKMGAWEAAPQSTIASPSEVAAPMVPPGTNPSEQDITGTVTESTDQAAIAPNEESSASLEPEDVTEMPEVNEPEALKPSLMPSSRETDSAGPSDLSGESLESESTAPVQEAPSKTVAPPPEEGIAGSMENSSGFSLPLWQLEATLGGLLVALALAGLWTLRRGGRWSRRAPA